MEKCGGEGLWGWCFIVLIIVLIIVVVSGVGGEFEYFIYLK